MWDNFVSKLCLIGLLLFNCRCESSAGDCLFEDDIPKIFDRDIRHAEQTTRIAVLQMLVSKELHNYRLVVHCCIVPGLILCLTNSFCIGNGTIH